MVDAGRYRKGQTPCWSLVSQHDVGQRVSALHPRIPQDHDSRHQVPPPFHQDRAGTHQYDNDVGVRCSYGLDERLVVCSEGERPAITALPDTRAVTWAIAE